MGFHDVSSEDDLPDGDSDPMDELDGLLPSAQPCSNVGIAQEDDAFQSILDDLAGSFLSKEEKGDPLSDKLANILNQSLRRRPIDENVKATAAKVKFPNNVDNLIVPVTNDDIIKAMTTGGKLQDARLARTNGILSKAIVPLARLLSDIGEKKCLSMDHYMTGLNASLRLVTAAFNYLNHLRKEVARIHIQDSALAKLCSWECEVGTTELFPFDVAKKCEEIHNTRKLGKPFHRHKPYASAQKRFRPYFNKRQGSLPSRYPAQSKPFLGHRQPQGRGFPRKLPQ